MIHSTRPIKRLAAYLSRDRDRNTTRPGCFSVYPKPNTSHKKNLTVHIFLSTRTGVVREAVNQTETQGRTMGRLLELRSMERLRLDGNWSLRSAFVYRFALCGPG